MVKCKEKGDVIEVIPMEFRVSHGPLRQCKTIPGLHRGSQVYVELVVTLL